jgi:imidazoleglycerol phosphate dehydratase HisB
MGCAIQLEWHDETWTDLGISLGRHIATFKRYGDSASAMGMLDDGSAEALVASEPNGRLRIHSAVGVDLNWFLSLRCEQLSSGDPLVELLSGLAEGLEVDVTVVVCNLEDPHHTWEGVFRAVGTCLGRMYTPPADALTTSTPTMKKDRPLEHGEIAVLKRSRLGAEIRRGTAESGIVACVDFDKTSTSEFRYIGPPIAHYAGTGALDSFARLLKATSETAGFSSRLTFTAKALSSSHVLLEDCGMALGRALREVLIERMMERGVQGGGDSLGTAEDFRSRKIRVALSVEGRKFWRFVPLDMAPKELQRRLIIGQTVLGGLYSEDLDDFLDGFSWGLGCSIMIHIKDLPPADEAWRLIFNDLGLALKSVFGENPYRRGVPPGVKANLA